MASKRVLLFASVASMIDQFNMSNITILKDNGCIVDVACNFSFGSTCTDERVNQFKDELSQKNIKYFNVLVPRSIFSVLFLFKAYKEFKKIVLSGNYNIVHCHSPIGGVICRFACRKLRRNGLKVIYTAHGFHFFKGAPIKNWLLYYPIERICARFTDTLITINNEDYFFAQKKFKNTNIEYIPGVGIDISRIESIASDSISLKKSLEIPAESLVLISVGELNKNKNHIVILEALSRLKRNDIYYVLVGKGQLSETLQNKSKDLGLQDHVRFLGFRRDVFQLLHMSDIFCFPSFREGLPVSAIEAMAAGLPLIASDVRGINDCCIIGENGILCNPSSVDDFSHAIERLLNNETERLAMGKKSIELSKKFDVDKTNAIMKKIYF